jgi:hypothetical protein
MSYFMALLVFVFGTNTSLADASILIPKITGPTTFLVNQRYSWQVTSTKNLNNNLFYKITYGDEPRALNIVGNPYPRTGKLNISHRYKKPGNYIIRADIYTKEGVVSTGVLSVTVTNKLEEASKKPVACTLEAKLCPDGSFVTRTGSNCEFSACPANTGSSAPAKDPPTITLPKTEPTSNPSTKSCITPWGNKTVANGETVSSQPYFSNGSYSGTVVVPIMKCNNGTWLTCDWQGNSCKVRELIQ